MTINKNQTCPIEELLVDLSPKAAEQVVGGFRSISERGEISRNYESLAYNSDLKTTREAC